MNESKRFTSLFNKKYYLAYTTDVTLYPLMYDDDPSNLIHFEIQFKPRTDTFLKDSIICLRSNQYNNSQLLEAINEMAGSLYGDRFIKDSIRLNNMGDIMWFLLKEI